MITKNFFLLLYLLLQIFEVDVGIHEYTKRNRVAADNTSKCKEVPARHHDVGVRIKRVKAALD